MYFTDTPYIPTIETLVGRPDGRCRTRHSPGATGSYNYTFNVNLSALDYNLVGRNIPKNFAKKKTMKKKRRCGLVNVCMYVHAYKHLYLCMCVENMDIY